MIFLMDILTCRLEKGNDVFHRIPVGITQCTRGSDLLAVDTEYITDDIAQAYRNFVPFFRWNAENNTLKHTYLNIIKVMFSIQFS